MYSEFQCICSHPTAYFLLFWLQICYTNADWQCRSIVSEFLSCTDFRNFSLSWPETPLQKKRPCPRLNSPSIPLFQYSFQSRLGKNPLYDPNLSDFKKSTCIFETGTSLLYATNRLLNQCCLVVLRMFVLLIYRFGAKRLINFSDRHKYSANHPFSFLDIPK